MPKEVVRTHLSVRARERRERPAFLLPPGRCGTKDVDTYTYLPNGQRPSVRKVHISHDHPL